MAYFHPILLGLQAIVPLHLVEKLLAHCPHAGLQSCAACHLCMPCNSADAGRHLYTEIHLVTETAPTQKLKNIKTSVTLSREPRIYLYGSQLARDRYP